jgi:FlaA1/EpsC-like NDP-sugar epimerase
LISGAGGSIGSEICRQIASFNPESIILLEFSEYNLYRINMELEDRFSGKTPVIPILGSVINKKLVDEIFTTYKPDCVLHAAAYKHVPIVEKNPISGIRNNIKGTKVLAEASLKHGVQNFILISSDKAVRPVNLMGASKRCCEMLIQAMFYLNQDKCRFSAVRFGNVLGSSGSVIPRFIEQIKKGGPVTVTHPDITRYFMLTSEAVSLVLQAAAFSQGGEIFVLNMGEPVKIYDMACSLIILAGKNPGDDIEITFTGLRSGEKLYEELVLEGTEQTSLHDDIFILKTSISDPQKNIKRIEEILRAAEDNDLTTTINLVKDMAFIQ